MKLNKEGNLLCQSLKFKNLKIGCFYLYIMHSTYSAYVTMDPLTDLFNIPTQPRLKYLLPKLFRDAQLRYAQFNLQSISTHVTTMDPFSDLFTIPTQPRLKYFAKIV